MSDKRKTAKIPLKIQIGAWMTAVAELVDIIEYALVGDDQSCEHLTVVQAPRHKYLVLSFFAVCIITFFFLLYYFFLFLLYLFNVCMHNRWHFSVMVFHSLFESILVGWLECRFWIEGRLFEPRQQYVVSLSKILYPHCFSRLSCEMSTRWGQPREGCSVLWAFRRNST